MKNFLGLPIFRKPLTDSQCVERARKDLTRFRRYGAWLIPLYLAPLIMLGFVVDVVRVVLIKAGGNQGNFLGGVFIGIVFGLPLGIAFFHFVEYFGRIVGLSKGDRTPELLVKYHDMLAELAHAEKESVQQNGAGQGRAGQGGT